MPAFKIIVTSDAMPCLLSRQTSGADFISFIGYHGIFPDRTAASTDVDFAYGAIRLMPVALPSSEGASLFLPAAVSFKSASIFIFQRRPSVVLLDIIYTPQYTLLFMSRRR